ncbi:unnamed protein product [Closterium sp. Naga37s-1]|nr:unnamed protein product [Closterium sp. Naga37s-1]
MSYLAQPIVGATGEVGLELPHRPPRTYNPSVSVEPRGPSGPASDCFPSPRDRASPADVVPPLPGQLHRHESAPSALSASTWSAPRGFLRRDAADLRWQQPRWWNALTALTARIRLSAFARDFAEGEAEESEQELGAVKMGEPWDWRKEFEEEELASQQAAGGSALMGLGLGAIGGTGGIGGSGGTIGPPGRRKSSWRDLAEALAEASRKVQEEVREFRSRGGAAGDFFRVGSWLALAGAGGGETDEWVKRVGCQVCSAVMGSGMDTGEGGMGIRLAAVVALLKAAMELITRTVATAPPATAATADTETGRAEDEEEEWGAEEGEGGREMGRVRKRAGEGEGQGRAEGGVTEGQSRAGGSGGGRGADVGGREADAGGSDASTWVLFSLARLCEPLESFTRYELAQQRELQGREQQGGGEADGGGMDGWFWGRAYPGAFEALLTMLTVLHRYAITAAIQDVQLSAKASGLDDGLLHPPHAALSPTATTASLAPRGTSSSAHVAGAARLADSDMALFLLLFQIVGAVRFFAPPEAVGCAAFSVLLEDQLRHLFDHLLRAADIDDVYRHAVRAGLRAEFLSHFGQRAGGHLNFRVLPGERRFWVQLVERQLRAALVREKIFEDWAEGEGEWGGVGEGGGESLKAELAVFGFFVALGRATRLFLQSEGASEADEGLATLLTWVMGHFEGAIIFTFPQLDNISKYQGLVEVLREELAWLPLLPPLSSKRHPDVDPSSLSPRSAQRQRHRQRRRRRRAVLVGKEVCGMWARDWERHSSWLLQQPESRAAAFMAQGLVLLGLCLEPSTKHHVAAEVPGVLVPSSDSDSSNEAERRLEGSRAVEMGEMEEVEREAREREEARRRLEKELRGLKVMERELKALNQDFLSVDEIVERLMKVVEAETAGKAGKGADDTSAAREGAGERAEEGVKGERTGAEGEGAAGGRGDGEEEAGANAAQKHVAHTSTAGSMEGRAAGAGGAKGKAAGAGTSERLALVRVEWERLVRVREEIRALERRLKMKAAVQEERVRRQQEEVGEKVSRQRRQAAAREMEKQMEQQQQQQRHSMGFLVTLGDLFSFSPSLTPSNANANASTATSTTTTTDTTATIASIVGAYDYPPAPHYSSLHKSQSSHDTSALADSPFPSYLTSAFLSTSTAAPVTTDTAPAAPAARSGRSFFFQLPGQAAREDSSLLSKTEGEEADGEEEREDSSRSRGGSTEVRGVAGRRGRLEEMERDISGSGVQGTRVEYDDDDFSPFQSFTPTSAQAAAVTASGGAAAASSSEPGKRDGTAGPGRAAATQAQVQAQGQAQMQREAPAPAQLQRGGIGDGGDGEKGGQGGRGEEERSEAQDANSSWAFREEFFDERAWAGAAEADVAAGYGDGDGRHAAASMGGLGAEASRLQQLKVQLRELEARLLQRGADVGAVAGAGREGKMAAAAGGAAAGVAAAGGAAAGGAAAGVAAAGGAAAGGAAAGGAAAAGAAAGTSAAASTSLEREAATQTSPPKAPSIFDRLFDSSSWNLPSSASSSAAAAAAAAGGEGGADAWRGTQLLSTDVAVAMKMLQRAALGQPLTDREAKVLKRTLTDMASVIPIGILMLIPMTPVGHAAVLAAIQRYAPHLFPSSYNEDRLDAARRLEQVRSFASLRNAAAAAAATATASSHSSSRAATPGGTGLAGMISTAVAGAANAGSAAAGRSPHAIPHLSASAAAAILAREAQPEAIVRVPKQPEVESPPGTPPNEMELNEGEEGQAMKVIKRSAADEAECLSRQLD